MKGGIGWLLLGLGVLYLYKQSQAAHAAGLPWQGPVQPGGGDLPYCPPWFVGPPTPGSVCDPSSPNYVPPPGDANPIPTGLKGQGWW
jgi:hypothetical protein